MGVQKRSAPCPPSEFQRIPHEKQAFHVEFSEIRRALNKYKFSLPPVHLPTTDFRKSLIAMEKEILDTQAILRYSMHVIVNEAQADSLIH